MAKITLNNILSGFNLTKINNNFKKIEDVINDKVLFRDSPAGEPNFLNSPIDANSNRIFNLPVPGSSSDPARLQDVINSAGGLFPAAAIPFSPSVEVDADNVQAAVETVSENLTSLANLVTDRTTKSVKEFGAVGDGINDDTAAIQAAMDWLSSNGGSKIFFPDAVSYKITDTIKIFNKPRSVIDFNMQLINAVGFTTLKPALHFKGISQSVIDNIFVIGNNNTTQYGVWFDADASNVSIHVKIGKIYTANCVTGVKIGNEGGWQLDDWTVQDIYASECNTGILVTGENTLAMSFGRVAAFLCYDRGLHLEQGSGNIQSVQVGYSSGYDLFFGQTNGLNGSKLNRWDILSGYTEAGANGEKWIGSVACADTSPFIEQITISNYR